MTAAFLLTSNGHTLLVMGSGLGLGPYHLVRAVIIRSHRTQRSLGPSSPQHLPRPRGRAERPSWGGDSTTDALFPGSPSQLVSAGQVHPRDEPGGLLFSHQEVLFGPDSIAIQSL